jgi:hypothetical protein
MRHPVAAVQLGSEFDAFLFAPVDGERNGMVLSVLSALARLDVDPWREAANRRLTSLIAALPDASSTRLQPGTIADRLIALPPRADIYSIASARSRLGADTAPNALGVAKMVAFNLLLMVGMLCAQWVLASLRPSADADTIHAPASGTALPPISPSGPGH